jgi:phage gp29-like protein
MPLQVNKKIGNPKIAFTPEFYRKAVLQYESGDMRSLIRMIEKSEIDDFISGCLIGRKAGFARDWRLIEASEEKQDIAVKEFVESILMSLNIDELFENIFEAKKKIYSVIELTWEIIEGKQLITKAELLHHRYFKYDEKGILKIDWGNNLVEIEKDSALICEHKKNPVLLPPLRDYILKEFGLESWAGFIETFGEAFVIASYPPGADDKFKSELEESVDAIASSTRGVKPENSNIEIIESKRNTGDHEKFVTQCNKGIAIAILGHAKAVDGQQSGIQVGENSEAFRVRRDIAISDIKFIEQYMFQLVKMLVDRNFNVKKYPVFTIDKSEPINVSERLKVLDSAYDKGFKIHPNEYGKLGLFVYEDQEPLVNPLLLGSVSD